MRQPIPSRPAVPASSRVVGGAGKNGANGKGPHRKKKRANQAIVVPRSVVPDHVYEGNVLDLYKRLKAIARAWAEEEEAEMLGIKRINPDAVDSFRLADYVVELAGADVPRTPSHDAPVHPGPEQVEASFVVARGMCDSQNGAIPRLSFRFLEALLPPGLR